MRERDNDATIRERERKVGVVYLDPLLSLGNHSCVWPFVYCFLRLFSPHFQLSLFFSFFSTLFSFPTISTSDIISACLYSWLSLNSIVRVSATIMKMCFLLLNYRIFRISILSRSKSKGPLRLTISFNAARSK